MAPLSPQNFENHARYVPLYHFVLGGILSALLVRTATRLFFGFSIDTLIDFMVAVSLLLTAFYARNFALAAQDRVIRLELRLRMQGLAPELMSRFDELSPNQITALRFAGDSELRDLVREVIDGRLVRGADIKQRIRSWKADEFRV